MLLSSESPKARGASWNPCGARCRGGGFLRNPMPWGVLKPPPPFFKNGPRGGFKGVFRRTHIICAIFFLVLFFWTAHPEFCPCSQFSHF